MITSGEAGRGLSGAVLTVETVCVTIGGGLQPAELERWVAEAWVRPDGPPGRYLFREIDVARVRLIHEIREDLRVGDDAVPVVLSLVDQLYEERRRMRRLRSALERALTLGERDDVLRRLGDALREADTFGG